MNELVPLGPKQPSKDDQPVSLALIAELSDIDRFKPLLVSRRLGWLTTDKEPRACAVREAIAEGEVVLANHAFKTLARELEAALIPASRTMIKNQIGLLMACFPSRDVDITVLTVMMVEHVLEANPSRLELTAAMRELRRTSKFRPSIAEVIEALKDARVPDAPTILKLAARLDKARERLPLLLENEKRKEQEMRLLEASGEIEIRQTSDGFRLISMETGRVLQCLSSFDDASAWSDAFCRDHGVVFDDSPLGTSRSAAGATAAADRRSARTAKE
jgi:hypothetical protein